MTQRTSRFNAESVQTVGIDAVGVVLILLAVAAIGGAAAVTAVVAYLCIGLTLGALAKKEWK